MGKIDINKFFTYRHRYIIGYLSIAVGILAVLIFAGLYSPGGITTLEQQSVISSSNISLSQSNTLAISDLPYHLLQKASLAMLGVTIFSIKLPSIILAFLSVIGVVILLRRWFKTSVSILASLIAISTGQFIFFAQDGTSGIIYIFWAVWLLLIPSLAMKDKIYKMSHIIAFSVIAALSLYTPLSIYILIAITFAIIFHPHLRYLIRKIPKHKKIIAAIISAILISPLVVFISISPELLPKLLGLPTKFPNIWENIQLLGSQYLGFASSTGSIMTTPFFELGSMIIVALGVYSVIKNRVTSKNYVIMFWSICIIPVIVMNPGFASVTFVPMILLLTSGLSLLLLSWYDLFPNNPYARFGGLIPIVVLVVALVLSGADRYVYGYRYSPTSVPNFSKDLNLIPKDYVNIVVSNEEVDFYSAVSKYNEKILTTLSPASEIVWVTSKANSQLEGHELIKIVTSSGSKDSDRFYVYKKLIN